MPQKFFYYYRLMHISIYILSLLSYIFQDFLSSKQQPQDLRDPKDLHKAIIKAKTFIFYFT